MKQNFAGYLIEVEVSKLVSQHLFCITLNECKSCSYLIQVDGNDFLFFFVLMRWNNTLLAIWLKWRSTNLFLNICFLKFWMNPKVDPIWFKWREMTFFLVLMRWNKTLLAIWLKWRSANFFPNVCFVKFWLNTKVVPIWFKWREMSFYFFSFLCGETKRCWLSDWSGGQQTCFLTSVL